MIIRESCHGGCHRVLLPAHKRQVISCLIGYHRYSGHRSLSEGFGWHGLKVPGKGCCLTRSFNNVNPNGSFSVESCCGTLTFSKPWLLSDILQLYNEAALLSIFRTLLLNRMFSCTEFFCQAKKNDHWLMIRASSPLTLFSERSADI